MADRYQEARDAITGDSWLDDLARMSLRAAEAKFGPKPEHKVYVTPVSYRVTIMPEACLRHPRSDLKHWNLSVEPAREYYRHAGDGWVVADGHQVLGRDGTWSYGPGDDDDEKAWQALYVFPLGAALDLAREHAPKVTINDLTAVEVLARHRARHLECCRG